ncbi:MAG: rhomboid family intramembrane serine protease [Dysgonamonadaceae bacterium]|jgi:membrane associated rhomboid family serine protease|nr:rhomboid family intramembrane serine protease [Dysgonamonadaceae bacterium]
MNFIETMSPATILTLITVAITIWAFNDRQIVEKLIMSPYAVVHKKQWWRIITHAFIHANWTHLIFNMIALWSFGVAVGNYFSQVTDMPQAQFYLMYFGAIIFSSIPDLKKRNNPNYLSLGASGGVSAVIFAAIFFNPWSLIYVFFLPCPGIVFGVLYLLYCSYMSKQGGNDNINHDAHFYGSIFGFIYPLLLEPSLWQYFIHQLTHPTF